MKCNTFTIFNWNCIRFKLKCRIIQREILLAPWFMNWNDLNFLFKSIEVSTYGWCCWMEFRVTLELVLRTLEINRTSKFLIVVLIIFTTHTHSRIHKQHEQKLRSIKICPKLTSRLIRALDSLVFNLSPIFDHRCLWSRRHYRSKQMLKKEKQINNFKSNKNKRNEADNLVLRWEWWFVLFRFLHFNCKWIFYSSIFIIVIYNG